MHQQEETVSRLVQKTEILYQIPGLLNPARRHPQQIPAPVVRGMAVVVLETAPLGVQDRAQLYQIWDLD